MKLFDETFIKNYCENNFAEFVSDSFVFLKESNSRYKSYIEQKSKILNEFPNIREMLENDDICDLKKEEVKALKSYLNLEDDCREMEEKEMFLRGMKEAYYLFKKLKLLK